MAVAGSGAAQWTIRSRRGGASLERTRLEMAPQAFEKPQFAAGNGRPTPRRSATLCADVSAALRKAARLEMAPQSVEEPQFAAENGMGAASPAR